MENAMDKIVEEVEGVFEIADAIYDKMVGDYFNTVTELSVRFRSNTNPVTDAELETILTLLPLKLFVVAESLSKLKLTNQIAKLKAKEEEKDKQLDYKLTSAVYEAVILRVEKELSYSRELIMSSKKIWESRRGAETPPIYSDVTADLPDYDISANNKQ